MLKGVKEEKERSAFNKLMEHIFNGDEEYNVVNLWFGSERTIKKIIQFINVQLQLSNSLSTLFIITKHHYQLLSNKFPN